LVNADFAGWAERSADQAVTKKISLRSAHPTMFQVKVYFDVVSHLFEMVREHLTQDWQGGISCGLERGYLI